MTNDQDAQIEHLLRENYKWQMRQSVAETLHHYFRQADRTCRHYETPFNQDDEEAAYDWADDRRAEQVQLCIDALPLEQRAAISTTMRNKESGRQVWSSSRAGEQHANYQMAKHRLLLEFSRAGLLMRSHIVA
jgi:hypothetical protein